MTEKTKHGAVISPKTMARVCEDLKLIGRWQTNEFEGGKGFPDKEAGGQFPDFPSDIVSAAPPKDGHILSGGKTDDRDCVNFTNREMQEKTKNPDFDWRDHALKLKCGEKFITEWSYHTEHKTRGYDWRLTKTSVDFSQRLTREDFEEEFDKQYNPNTPYWKYSLPVSHTTETIIPTKPSGIYVLLERWIVADTGMAFHQSWVVDIENSDTKIIGSTAGGAVNDY